jgi:signal transduction histidine kinase/tetratricopeptide (TPR) repeat protein
MYYIITFFHVLAMPFLWASAGLPAQGIAENQKKIDSLNGISRDNSLIDPELSYKLAIQALAFAEEENYDIGIAYAYRNLANVAMRNQNNMATALQFLTKAHQIFEEANDVEGKANIDVSLGHVFSRLDSFELSLSYHQKAHQFFKDQENEQRLAVTSYNLGDVYMQMNDLENASVFLSSAFKYAVNVNNLPLQIHTIQRMGDWELAKGNQDKAYAHYQEVIERSSEELGASNKISLVSSLVSMARISSSRGEQDKTLEFLIRARDVSESFMFFDFLTEIYHETVDVLLERGQTAEAVILLDRYYEVQKQVAERNKEIARQFSIEFIQRDGLVKNLNRQQEENDSQLRQSRLFVMILILMMTALVYAIVSLRKIVSLYKGRQKQLEAIIENAQEGIVFLDHRLRIIKTNQKLLQIFDLVGNKNLPEKITELLHIPSHIFYQGKERDLELEYHRPGKTSIFYTLKISKENISGKIYHIAFVYDNTEAVTMKMESIEQDLILTKTFEIAGVGGYEMEMDVEGKIRLLNLSDASKVRLGIGETEDLTQIPLEERLLPEDVVAFRNFVLQNLEKEEFFDFIFHFRPIDGKPLWLRIISKAKLMEDGKSRIRGLIEDITEYREQNLVLENNLVKEKELVELKSKFISIASHEFKTPLSALVSSIEILKIYFQKVNNPTYEEKVNKQFEKIHRQLDRLDQTLVNILLVEENQRDGAQIMRENIGINHFLTNLVADYFSENPSVSKLVLNLPEDETLLTTDKNMLYFVVNNLISNALKYSPVGAQSPILEVTKRSKLLEIKIQDFGIGIPEADQAKLFSSFFRARNTSGHKGTGLGLKIVKDFVEKLEGELKFESKEGKGSTFFVTLPID